MSNGKYLIGSLAFHLIEVRQFLELELIACVHDDLSFGQTILANQVYKIIFW